MGCFIQSGRTSMVIRTDQTEFLFIPIRHHSPGCAYALLHAIKDFKPDHICIEAPCNAEPLIPALQSNAITPPIALYSWDTLNEGTARSFYPFCEYSPEWQAIRCAAEENSNVSFIDIPSNYRIVLQAEGDINLLNDEALSSSSYMQGLVKKSGCRDFDELWDRLFEDISRDRLKNYKEYFSTIYTFCEYSRKSSSTDYIKQSGDAERENHMLECIKAVACDSKKVLIVSGGFHTPALIEGIQKDTEIRGEAKQGPADMFIIPYSYKRLDSLNGYGAGMPFPGYYHFAWQDLGSHPDLKRSCIDIYAALAHASREKEFIYPVNTAAVEAAVSHSFLLASLRDKNGPGRCEIIDSWLSCIIKEPLDSLSKTAVADLHAFFSPSDMGTVADETFIPPLLVNARSYVKSFRISVSDSGRKRSKIDYYRKPAHRLRSRMFYKFSFMEANFCHRLKSVNSKSLYANQNLFEEWEYAWSPLVEARILEHSHLGEDIDTVVTSLLHTKLDSVNEQNSTLFRARMLIAALEMGLQDAADNLLIQCEKVISNQGNPFDCIDTLRFFKRQSERTFLFDVRDDYFNLVIEQLFLRILYLFNMRTSFSEEDAEKVSDGFSVLFEIVKQQSFINPEIVLPLWKNCLLEHAGDNRFKEVQGAAIGCAALEGLIDDAGLSTYVQRNFGVGASPEIAVQSFKGIIKTAPELFIISDQLIAALIQLVDTWDDEIFMRYLPSMRRGFESVKKTWLHEIAQKIAIKSHTVIDISPLKYSPAELQQLFAVYNEMMHQESTNTPTQGGADNER